MNTEQTSENIFTYVSTSYCFVSCNQTLVRSFDSYSKSFLYLNNLFYLKGRNVTSYVLVTSSWSQSTHQRCFIKKLFLKFLNVHRKTPMLESLFNKVAIFQFCNFFLRTPFSQNTSRRLLPWRG